MTFASLLLALVVTSAADTSSGEPVLLDFHASWCGPCQTMRPEVKRLTLKNYPIQSVDIDRSPEIAQQYHVERVPTFIVADSQGRVLARTEGVTPAADLARFYNEAKLKAADSAPEPPRAHRVAQTSADRAVDEPEGESSDSVAAAPVNPRPWETVVRIKMHLSSKEWGFGSGTIIYSDANESIILTCAHIFRDKAGRQQKFENFTTPISVDLFDGKTFVSQKPAMLRCIEKDIPGKALDYDFTNDVGLIRIRPGRVLPASKVVPESWQPKRGLPMFSVGCSHGEDATAWNTRILDPRVKMNSGDSNKSFYEMKCEFQPSEGRSGGGLYTSDGYVAGVCDFADPNEHVGLYATPAAIHRLLDHAKLTALYKNPSNDSGAMLASTTRSATRVRAQSPSDAEASGAPQGLTIPPPGMFAIPTPEVKVASNREPAPSWHADEVDATLPSSRPSRRPTRESGEAIDPGARSGEVVATEVPREPSSDSAILDLPDPARTRGEVAPEPSPTRRAQSSWKGTHTTRPRPAH